MFDIITLSLTLATTILGWITSVKLMVGFIQQHKKIKKMLKDSEDSILDDEFFNECLGNDK